MRAPPLKTVLSITQKLTDNSEELLKNISKNKEKRLD